MLLVAGEDCQELIDLTKKRISKKIDCEVDVYNDWNCRISSFLSILHLENVNIQMFEKTNC